MAQRYQVPQFVDIEDKIIGPLTLKQFLIFFAAVLVLIPVYLFSDLSLFVTLALPVLAIAAAFSFVKIGGKSLFEMIINATTYMTGGQVWLWRRGDDKRLLKVRGPAVERMVQEAELAGLSEPERSRLDTISRTLETEGNVASEEDLPDPLLNDQGPVPNDQPNPKP